MRLHQVLASGLARRLPACQRARMAADAIAWLYADEPMEERQAAVEALAARLLERIEAGQVSLQLVVYYHLLQLPTLGGLRSWILSGGAYSSQETSPRQMGDGIAGAPRTV